MVVFEARVDTAVDRDVSQGCTGESAEDSYCRKVN